MIEKGSENIFEKDIRIDFVRDIWEFPRCDYLNE